MPFLRGDIGPVAVGSFLGAKLELSEETQTTWQHPTLQAEDWANLSFLDFDPGNRWFQAVLKLARLAGELDPRGLAIWADDVSTPAEADAAFQAVVDACGGRC